MRSTKTLLLLCIAPALAGCVVAAAAVVGAAAAYGAVKYTENGAYQDFKTDFDTTWMATIASMKEMGYGLPKDLTHTPTEGKIKAGDTVADVEKHAEGFTRVNVTIGTFQSEEHKRKAKLLLDNIAKRLGQ